MLPQAARVEPLPPTTCSRDLFPAIGPCFVPRHTSAFLSSLGLPMTARSQVRAPGEAHGITSVPNLVTALRIALIPALVAVFYLPYRWSHAASATLFTLAAITDWLDGYRRVHGKAQNWDTNPLCHGQLCSGTCRP